MWVGVQVRGLKAPRDQVRVEGRLVHPASAEETRALDHVEGAELGCHDPDDAQVARTNVRAGHIDPVRSAAVRGQPTGDGLDQL
jgi:hypothetical protein